MDAPIEMKIDIKQARTAVEFWLKNAVFRADVKVRDVSFESRTNTFLIEFLNNDKEEK